MEPERTAAEVAKIVGGDAKKLRLAAFDGMIWRPEADGMWRPFPDELAARRADEATGVDPSP